MFQDGDQSSSHHIHIPEGQTEEGKQQKKQIEIAVAFKRSTTQVLQKIRTNRVEREKFIVIGSCNYRDWEVPQAASLR